MGPYIKYICGKKVFYINDIKFDQLARRKKKKLHIIDGIDAIKEYAFDFTKAAFVKDCNIYYVNSIEELIDLLYTIKKERQGPIASFSNTFKPKDCIGQPLEVGDIVAVLNSEDSYPMCVCSIVNFESNTTAFVTHKYFGPEGFFGTRYYIETLLKLNAEQIKHAKSMDDEFNFS